MCTFISAYITWDGKIRAGDLRSHSSAEEVHNLSAALKSNKPPVPFEWSKDDNGESIEVRIPDGVDRDVNYYKAIILGTGETRGEFLAALLDCKTWKGDLDLSGCDLSTIDKLPDGCGWLDLRGCDLSTFDKLPEGCEYLDLSGCNLSTFDRLPGGCKYLYLRGCDLSTITNLDTCTSNIII